MIIQSYRDLDIWKKSMDLVVLVYEITKKFPKEEMYGLTSQIRRAAVSIPSNIAEGLSKRSTKDFIRFLNIAYGSIAELETQSMLAKRLQYISKEQLQLMLASVAEIGRMTNGMITKLQEKVDIAKPRMLNAEC